MKSIPTDVFLSCSFRDEDREVVNLVKAICRALDINCKNVGDGFSQVPPDKAREYIRNLPGIVAITTRREHIRDEEYSMPSAVREEISMGYALGKPILLIREDGVQFDGFMNNYGTYLPVSRTSLWQTDSIEKLVASIHNLKMSLLPPDDSSLFAQTSDYYAEVLLGLIELEKTPEDFVWATTVTRKLRFTRDFTGELKSGVWPDKAVRIDKDAPNLEWKIKFDSGSKDFELIPEVKEISPALLDVSIKVIPAPQENDFLEYTFFWRSKYSFPIYPDQATTYVMINGKEYSAIAGIIRSVRTEILKLNYRFPKEYGLNSRDVSPLVATYSSTLGHVVENEIGKLSTSIDTIGGNVIVSVIANKPLMGCMYGIAWVPPQGSNKPIVP